MVRSKEWQLAAAANWCAEAKAALTSLGWKPSIASAAVAAAAAKHDATPTLEQLVFEALRRCPVPKA
jgi:Holliday junction resolvasome RuvABC DNA-binding subunit